MLLPGVDCTCRMCSVIHQETDCAAACIQFQLHSNVALMLDPADSNQLMPAVPRAHLPGDFLGGGGGLVILGRRACVDS